MLAGPAVFDDNNQAVDAVTWRQPQQAGPDCTVFIMFTWNFDLFRSSLQTYLAAGLGPCIIIIDNSKDRRILNDAGVSPAHACE